MSRQTLADTVIEPDANVSAGTVVTRHVSPNLIVGGVLAQAISSTPGNTEA